MDGRHGLLPVAIRCARRDLLVTDLYGMRIDDACMSTEEMDAGTLQRLEVQPIQPLDFVVAVSKDVGQSKEWALSFGTHSSLRSRTQGNDAA